MSGEIKVLKVSPTTGTDVTMGDSGDKFTFASGSEVDLTGVTKTGFPATGNNTPMFSAYLSSNQNLADATYEKVEFDTISVCLLYTSDAADEGLV